jgi:hypothetical protein
MLINLDTKEVFIHIPKTGGHTVGHSLRYWKVLDGATHTHINIEQFKETVKNFSEYKIYTFVRNPYTRFNSMYNFLLIMGYVDDTPITFATNIFLGKYELVFVNPMCYFCKKEQLTDFGRVETFDEDFKRMFKCENLGIKNKTNYGDVYERFPQLRDMVARLYYEDFVDFGYEIQPFIYKNIKLTWQTEDLKEIGDMYIKNVTTHSVCDNVPLIFIKGK